MKPIFTDSIAESREAFLAMARNSLATFFEVYSSIPHSELESLFEEGDPEIQFLRFDMQAHSESSRLRFCHLSDLERRAYGFPKHSVDKPLPFFGAFVQGIGHVGIAWTDSEVRELILRTQKDIQRAKQISVM